MAKPAAQNPLKSLASLPRGGPVAAATLKELGISSALASHYVSAGWLMRLGRGVFMFPNDQLNVGPCVSLLSRGLEGLYVGGKTALAWRGIRHNVGPREKLHLWGETQHRLPRWFTKRFPARYVTRHLFDSSLPANFGLQPLPETPDGPVVSVPERALLELLSDVGTGQGVEEARNIMEGVRSPRLDVLVTLLKHCQRVKVVRLCVQWSEELNLPWATEVRKLARPRGHNRWSNKFSDGTTLVLKP